MTPLENAEEPYHYYPATRIHRKHPLPNFTKKITASFPKQVRFGAKERIGLELAARPGLQLAVVQRTPAISSRWRDLDVAPVNFNGRDEREHEQQDGQQLAEAPLLLAVVGERHRGRAKRRRQQDDAHGGADGNGRHDEQPGDLHRLVPGLLLRAAVQVPRGEHEDDHVARNHGNGADIRQRVLCAAGGLAKRRRRRLPAAVPGARHGQRGKGHAAGDDLQRKDARDAREGEVGEHEGLPQPAQDPVAAVVADEGQQRRVVRRHGQQREHPDEEEVVRHERAHLGEADRLQADALHDLRVAEAAEELAPDACRTAAHLGGDDAGGQAEGEYGGDHEGEENLGE
ncbi:hypothetical protein CCM_06006 [Cordyceps militaris CM01]|uniref:Uncharacterized protein n=1 Tax=Cordyceps militaris (strain CM01) TaxID=983644 RepID=G3JI99_CORMM|nr:uncharacterized protein CCM_06006 [Cordyceps militaris CM01]EGX91849.1 hypothetical protein CCM_06006 [Cordyceps militaris CM01]